GPLNENIIAVATGGQPTNIITKVFFDIYVFIGGSGATLGLIIAILLISRRQEYRVAAKIGLSPGLFQINEPVIFGVPIVLNPILLIPFLLTPLVLTTVAYFSTAIGFAGYTQVVIPWTTPPILSAFLATGGSIGATITALINLALSIIIYLPFVAASNRIKQEDL
ncbi:MAG: PTS transporter subunit EIIC, partial [Bacilli bacterium]